MPKTETAETIDMMAELKAMEERINTKIQLLLDAVNNVGQFTADKFEELEPAINMVKTAGQFVSAFMTDDNIDKLIEKAMAGFLTK